MSGRDETFVPSDAKESNPPPFPPAPPSFGQNAPSGDPLVVFKAADAPPGFRTFSGPPMRPDAEETMTPPPPRFGTPVPDAEKTMMAPPPFDPAATAASHGVPFDAMPPQSAPPPMDEAKRTVSATPSHTTPPPMNEARATPPRTAPPMDEGERTVAMPPRTAPPMNEGERTVSAMPSHAAPSLEEAERTIVDPPTPSTGTERSTAGAPSAPSTDAERSTAVVRVGPGSARPGSAVGPELTPDAILPPGTAPQTPPEQPHDIGATSTGPIPRLGPGASFPGGPGMAPPGATPGRPSGAHRALLVGGAALGTLLIGGMAVLGVTELSGGSKDHHAAHSQAPVPPPVPKPTPSPTKHKPKHKPKPPPVDIRDEKKDPRPLTVREVFPSHHVKIGGHTFTIVKTVINDQCGLAANGSFAVELTRQHCRRVVRATFVSADKKLAVTTGIAVMPTDAAAAASLKEQDPTHYQWFRGMKATGAPKIDRAGGYAASMMRGRYISYAYATYASGRKPAKNDKTLKSIGNGFRDYTIRAIIKRAHH